MYNPINDPVIWIVLFVPLIIIGIFTNIFIVQELLEFKFNKNTKLIFCLIPYSVILLKLHEDL